MNKFKYFKFAIKLFFPIYFFYYIKDRFVSFFYRLSIEGSNYLKLIDQTKENNSDEKLLDEMRSNFSKTCELWGVNNDNIKKVKSFLQIEGFFYTFFSFFSATNLVVNSLSFYSLFYLLVSVFFLFVASSKFWRYDILNSQKFIPYKEWLFSTKD